MLKKLIPGLPATRAKKPPTVKLPEDWAGWGMRAREELGNAMRERNVGYKELSRRLSTMGIEETPDRLNRKVNRMKFSAAFFLACLEALKDADTWR